MKSNARATLDKQSCVISPTFVYHDYWSLVKAGHTTFLKTKRLLQDCLSNQNVNSTVNAMR